ncbi:hypothetical protein [Gordonia sp. NPDC003950]
MHPDDLTKVRKALSHMGSRVENDTTTGRAFVEGGLAAIEILAELADRRG